MWFKADVITQKNVTMTAVCIWCACQYVPVRHARTHKGTTGKGKLIRSLCISTMSLYNHRYFINCTCLHMKIRGSFVSFSPSCFLCLWGDRSHTSQNYILGAVMHKQHLQLKEAQIIWCPAPQELAAVDMTARAVTPCRTATSDGFRVLIKAILITSPQIRTYRLSFLYAYKLSPFQSVYRSSGAWKSKQTHHADKKWFKAVSAVHRCPASFHCRPAVSYRTKNTVMIKIEKPHSLCDNSILHSLSIWLFTEMLFLDAAIFVF